MSKLELMTDQDVLLECLGKGTIVIGPNNVLLTVYKAVTNHYWKSCRKFDRTGEFIEMIENPETYNISDDTIWVVCHDIKNQSFVYPFDQVHGVQLRNK